MQDEQLLADETRSGEEPLNLYALIFKYLL